MTEEIINSDGSRNWEANILLDNIKRLEHERDELKKACDKCKLFDIEKTNRDLLEQIDRIEQDIEQLTQWLDEARRNTDFWCDKCTSLEQENKELKETIKQYCEWLDEERESNDKLQKVYQNDHCDLLNYRSALEEIKNSVINYLPKENYKFAKSFNPEEFELLENILTKINEVLE